MAFQLNLLSLFDLSFKFHIIVNFYPMNRIELHLNLCSTINYQVLLGNIV